MNDLVNRARDFAYDKHSGQLYGDKPYTYHLDQVYNLLNILTDNQIILSAAYLHDTLEDTKTTFTELAGTFGLYVANLVRELTKTGSNEFTNLKTRDAILIKFADRLANLSNMQGWDNERVLRMIEKSTFWS
jgi:(p)ppGpp synthase/HD superfamily hydrolase